MALETYFISDLHLAHESVELNAAFYAFIELIKGHAKCLVINGDFFNTWWGPSLIKDAFSQEIAKSLASLKAAGCQTHFINGNRDFLLSKDADKLNMRGHGDHFFLREGEHATAVTHGDQFCLDDKGHQFLRLLTHTLPLHSAAKIAPDALALRLANWLRGRSKAKSKPESTAPKPTSYYDLKDAPMRRYMARKGADTLICGHIHRPQERSLEVNGKSCRVLVLSDWKPEGAVIAASASGQAPALYEFRDGEIRPWQHTVRANAQLSSGDDS